MHRIAIAALLLSALAAAAAAGADPSAEPDAAGRIAERIREPEAREIVQEVLERNPALAAAASRAEAARQRSTAARALPEPMAQVTAFPAPPETRVGPQRLMAGISQRLPWRGKRGLRESAAGFAAEAALAGVEAERLALLTETRRLLYELGFLRRNEEILHNLEDHFAQHEEVARARYSTGVGGGQAVVKLQAEITRVQKRLLDIGTRRAALAARLNELRDRPAGTPVPLPRLPPLEPVRLKGTRLLDLALARRPEMRAAEAEISRAEAQMQLAEKAFRPDFSVGLTYTVVDRRDDPAGRLAPPPDNGEDVLGLQGGVVLPLWRKRLSAGREEAAEMTRAASESRRRAASSIEGALGDLEERLPLLWRQLRLLEDVLLLQAEEALASVQAGYVAGTQTALDLLDAEHVLFEAETAIARAAADYLIALARLEGAVGEPLTDPGPHGGECI